MNESNDNKLSKAFKEIPVSNVENENKQEIHLRRSNNKKAKSNQI